MKKEKDVVKFLSMFVKELNFLLERILDFLKNLKEVGVVDFGGKGFVFIYEGMLVFIKGDNIEIKNVDLDINILISMDFIKSIISIDDIKYCYCIEFILESFKVEDIKIRDIMMVYGDSLVVVGDDGVIKVYVYINDLGNVF